MATNERYMPVPPEAVWDVLAEPDNYGYWVVGSKAIRDAEPDWPAPGSKLHHTIGFGPLTLDDHTVALESERPHRFRLRAKGRPVGTATVTLEMNRKQGGTLVKMSENPDGVYAVVSFNPLDGARAYGAANEAALAWMADRVERDAIDCDFRRRASYAYLGPDADRADAEREAEAALAAGLPASLVEETPLPYPVAAAVRFDDQAEFHVRKYLLALADELDEVYEHSHAVQVDDHGRCVVKTPGGSVTADHVVVATHYPFLDRALAFARVSQQRSYALLCRIAGEPPPGMFISGDSPTRSVRAVPVDGEELLLVGGEGHKTGEGGDTEERYRTLERFAREHWDVESVAYRWSSQDGTTIDGVPYVGPLTPRNEHVLMATGFAKWGMTGGTAAAMILSDRLLGRENPWAELFNPNRIKPRAAVRFVEESAKELGCRRQAHSCRPVPAHLCAGVSTDLPLRPDRTDLHRD